MKIVAFTGKKGTGKSTACAYLEEKYGFTRVNFKDALIAELKQNFPELLGVIGEVTQEFIPPEGRVNITDLLFQLKPPLIRTLMQNYGTNVRRKDRDDYWVKQWDLYLRGMPKNLDKFTVDDVRFINERATIRHNGGIVIRLIRTDMEHTDSHISETEMDSIVPDFTIVCNGGDYEHLYKELDAIMAK